MTAVTAFDPGPMKLVQLLLPVKSGLKTSGGGFEHVLAELTDHFGGATASLQAPAEVSSFRQDRFLRNTNSSSWFLPTEFVS